MARYKKRSDGRYTTQIVIGHKPDGKPKVKALYGKTIRELDDKIAAFKMEMKQGIADTENPTVKQWAEKWRKTKDSLSYKSRRNYDLVIDTHIVPAIGNIRLRDLKLHHIQSLIDDQLRNGHSRMAQYIRLTIRQILDYAVKNQLLNVNVATLTNQPKNKKSMRTALSESEMKNILSIDLSIKQRAFICLLLYTGLRRGEALALTISDIDLKSQVVTVNKSLYTESNQPFIKDSPKSEAGNRSIKIIDVLCQILKEYIKTLNNEILFPSEHDGYMSYTAFRLFWDKIKEAISMPKVTPHVFRHTYATSLYYAGVDVKTAQYLMGHASSQLTLDLYTHLDMMKKVHNEDKIGAYFANIQSDD